jgi:hypothetical protein
MGPRRQWGPPKEYLAVDQIRVLLICLNNGALSEYKYSGWVYRGWGYWVRGGYEIFLSFGPFPLSISLRRTIF